MASETASMLLTFGSFGASYLVRPLGGMIIGAYEVRRGRRSALLLTVGLMMVGTAIIALIPSYSKIGLVAPVGIFAARLIQGFSAGGEFGASTAMLIEQTPLRSGFLSSWQFATQGLALLLASLFGFVLTGFATPAELASWGWRVPFFFGLLIGPVGLYLRRFVEDGPVYLKAEHTRTPIRDVFRRQKSMLLVSIGTLTLSTAVNHLLQYVPTFAMRELHLAASTGFAASALAGAVLTIVTPFAGHLSDWVPQTDVVGSGVMSHHRLSDICICCLACLNPCAIRAGRLARAAKRHLLWAIGCPDGGKLSGFDSGYGNVNCLQRGGDRVRRIYSRHCYLANQRNW
jgi:MHS family proline/betaine transporter-like MFS transporter